MEREYLKVLGEPTWGRYYQNSEKKKHIEYGPYLLRKNDFSYLLDLSMYATSRLANFEYST